jgi:hypothetical protein
MCSVSGCDRHALYKVAAAWSDGTSRELKNYGLACEEHRQDQLDRAKTAREGLKLAEGEVVGSVGLYQLLPGVRDAELTRLSN